MKRAGTLIALILAVATLAMANLLWGAVRIPVSDVWDILCGHDIAGHTAWTYIIRESRIPQMLTALLCGSALSTCGLLLQTTFRNPLAGPSILGIDAGANLGVAIVMLLLGGAFSMGTLTLGGYLLVILAAMAGALGIMALLLGLSQVLRSRIMLLITGVIISYVTGSIIQLLNYSSTEEGVHSFIVWGMGNFSSVSRDRLPVFCLFILTGLLSSALLVKPLDAMLLGERYAQSLGIRVHRIRQGLLLTTGILTATTTAFCGPISFLGLAVPHIARLTLGTSTHRILLPATMLMGAVLTLSCNLLCTLPFGGRVIPINVVTPLIGAPVILYIILKK